MKKRQLPPEVQAHLRVMSQQVGQAVGRAAASALASFLKDVEGAVEKIAAAGENQFKAMADQTMGEAKRRVRRARERADKLSGK